MSTAVVVSGPPRDVMTLAAITTTVAAWASAFVVIRWAGESFSPGPLALGRLLVGSLALGALILARRRWVAPTRWEWALLVLCGLAWFGVYNVALNAAEQHLDAGTTAMLVNIGPILIALFAGLLLGEGFPHWLIVGAGVAFTGTLMIGPQPHPKATPTFSVQCWPCWRPSPTPSASSPRSRCCADCRPCR